MHEKRKRELEVNHMHNVISFHALIVTIIFLSEGSQGRGTG